MVSFKSSLLNNNPVSSDDVPALMTLNPSTEPIFEIDVDTRKIKVPQELYNICVSGDHLSEKIYFKCPRYFDDEDFSTHTCLIRFTNAKKVYGESPVVDMKIETDFLTFGWAIDNRATAYNGEISFTVQFETINEGIKYQWQTTPAKLNVMAGLDIESALSDKNDTVFRSLTKQVADLQEIVNKLQIKSGTIDGLSVMVNKLSEDVKYLQDNVVYTLN